MDSDSKFREFVDSFSTSFLFDNSGFTAFWFLKTQKKYGNDMKITFGGKRTQNNNDLNVHLIKHQHHYA